MLHIKNLSYAIGARQLLSDINMVINKETKYALIGPNGSGKTTLIRIMNGEIEDYTGTITRPRHCRVGYLPQEEIPFSGSTVLKTVMGGIKEISSIQEKLSDIHEKWGRNGQDSATIINQAEQLHREFQSLEGYSLEHRSKKILYGLGFSETDMNREVPEFSGGWKMRIYLSRMLIQNPHLLLLDEPTNHLDLPALEWLDSFLKSYRGSALIVSHDRFLIDRIADKIFELDRSQIKLYPGRYHLYEAEIEKERENTQKKYREYLKEKERLEQFINRFRYKATKAAQAQDRIKSLEKLEYYEPDHIRRTLSFKIGMEKKSARQVLKIIDLFFKYESEWVLNQLNLEIFRGEKIAVIGENGSGKTTLTKLICGQLSPQGGTIVLGENVKTGYYSQHQTDSLNIHSTAFQEVSSAASLHTYPQVRNILGLFGFGGEDIHKRIKVLSGGEKARVSLARILISSTNFLIMDEPLNHLDMLSKQALERALKEYEGTLMVISHDRYFLDKIVSRVVEISDGRCLDYSGNYSYYIEKRDLPEIKEDSAGPETRPEKDRKRRKKMEAEQRQKISSDRKRLNTEIQQTEKQIDTMEIRRREIEGAMARPETYENRELIIRLQKELAEINKKLPSLYEKWEKAEASLAALLETVKNI